MITFVSNEMTEGFGVCLVNNYCPEGTAYPISCGNAQLMR